MTIKNKRDKEGMTYFDGHFVVTRACTACSSTLNTAIPNRLL
ncbi:MAG TPA: hypothetical protein VHJ38_04685 [Nitrososphaeraceae archaeon]|jgi:hypothetical protein|nr:hypothetical protein [Nitrososphaeraceae archaeon]